MLRDGGGPVLREYPLGPALAQCCGGHMTLLFELMRAPAALLLVFGSGHVGREMAKVLSGVPGLRLRLIDERAAELPSAAGPGVELVHTAAPLAEIRDARAGAMYLIMTHSHDLDQQLVEAVLARGDAAYCGLIGSQTKRARFVKRAKAQGITDAQLEKLTCPIGLSGIAGKHPRVIALSVAAQILALGPGAE